MFVTAKCPERPAKRKGSGSKASLCSIWRTSRQILLHSKSNRISNFPVKRKGSGSKASLRSTWRTSMEILLHCKTYRISYFPLILPAIIWRSCIHGRDRVKHEVMKSIRFPMIYIFTHEVVSKIKI